MRLPIFRLHSRSNQPPIAVPLGFKISLKIVANGDPDFLSDPTCLAPLDALAILIVNDPSEWDPADIHRPHYLDDIKLAYPAFRPPTRKPFLYGRGGGTGTPTQTQPRPH
jgi:hypothetical protein